MTHLKKNAYYNRKDFTKHICTICLGRYFYDGSKSISFLEIAEYLNVTADSLRMRKKDAKVMAMLEAEGIAVIKVKGVNHYHLTNIELYTEVEEVEDEEEVSNTIVI
ncbi:hypothetical protein ACSU64_04435 [Bacillaceae bacterium C204]|uniref:hypothetical protein n=1 Tax=Neobacillus sp. 204 TaxID=3383351 RepID=UPI00397D3E4D